MIEREVFSADNGHIFPGVVFLNALYKSPLNGIPMKNIIAILFITSTLVSGICAAEEISGTKAIMSDQERIDSLIKQNQMLIEENMGLKNRADKATTKEEAFASCMQATKGETSAMAAESIGSHCDKLLKK